MSEVFLDSKRKVTSIFVAPNVWQPFKKLCRVTVGSTCHVLEAFMYAYVKGVPAMPGSPLPVVNVNLTVNRVVSKHRRKVYPDDGSLSILDGGLKNIVRRADGSWYYL